MIRSRERAMPNRLLRPLPSSWSGWSASQMFFKPVTNWKKLAATQPRYRSSGSPLAKVVEGSRNDGGADCGGSVRDRARPDLSYLRAPGVQMAVDPGQMTKYQRYGQKTCPGCGVLIDRESQGCRKCSPAIRRGEEHPGWKGDNLKHRNSGNWRARWLYPEIGDCERCGVKPATERHHVDGNTFNNERVNLLFVCTRCHMVIDGRLQQNQERARKQRKPLPCVICGKVVLGKERRHGRCHNCRAYFERRGSERPEELWKG